MIPKQTTIEQLASYFLVAFIANFKLAKLGTVSENSFAHSLTHLANDCQANCHLLFRHIWGCCGCRLD